MIISLPILQDENNTCSDCLPYSLELWDNSGLIAMQVDNKVFHFDNDILYLLYKMSNKARRNYKQQAILDNIIEGKNV